MKHRILRIVWGVVSVSIYFLAVSLLIFYFNQREVREKRHYVKKNENRIQVALSSPKKRVDNKQKKQTKSKTAQRQKKSTKQKKHTEKKVIKEKVVKKVAKKKEQNLSRPKKRPKDLFANIKTEKRKPLIQVSSKPVSSKPKKQLFEIKEKRPSASERISDSLKVQKEMDSGVEDFYLAKVQEMLEGWPAQSDFAGEKVKVYLKIKPSGYFEFVIKRKSNNPAFNEALSDYLKQLQEFGFGPHKGKRTYLFEAEFIAKD